MSDKTYTGAELEVTFDPARCLHAAESVRGLPSVFDTSRKPWILPDGASAAEIAEVVARCPSGALHVRDTDIDAEPHGAPQVDAPADGPLWVSGDIRLTVVDHDEVPETPAALCRCGQSSNRPFCDASGPCTGWRDAG